MKQGSTLFLKTIVILLGLAALTLCIYMPTQIHDIRNVGDYFPPLFGLYATAIPFFIGLFQGFKLLTFVDKNQAFSELSVKALNIIKYCALAITLVYIAGTPYLYAVAQEEDAPGVLAFGILFGFAAFVVATFVAVLQQLLHNIIEIKSENELTV